MALSFSMSIFRLISINIYAIINTLLLPPIFVNKLLLHTVTYYQIGFDNIFTYIYKKCMQVVCRLYAGCMQVVCRFTKPIPVRLYASYTLFFPINYFVIKYIYIYKEYMQKKCNICNHQYQCVLQRCNRSVTNCNQCNRRLEAGYNCLYLKFKGFFSLFFFC